MLVPLPGVSSSWDKFTSSVQIHLFNCRCLPLKPNLICSQGAQKTDSWFTEHWARNKSIQKWKRNWSKCFLLFLIPHFNPSWALKKLLDSIVLLQVKDVASTRSTDVTMNTPDVNAGLHCSTFTFCLDTHTSCPRLADVHHTWQGYYCSNVGGERKREKVSVMINEPFWSENNTRGNLGVRHFKHERFGKRFYT